MSNAYAYSDNRPRQHLHRGKPPAVITVTNGNDSGPGSLRQALVQANDGDTINFAVTGTIRLTSGELLVDKTSPFPVPAQNLTIDGNQALFVFHGSFPGKITISGLTITNGTLAGIYRMIAAEASQ